VLPLERYGPDSSKKIFLVFLIFSTNPSHRSKRPLWPSGRENKNCREHSQIQNEIDAENLSQEISEMEKTQDSLATPSASFPAILFQLIHRN
jgi:hypothetical protein